MLTILTVAYRNGKKRKYRPDELIPTNTKVSLGRDICPRYSTGCPRFTMGSQGSSTLHRFCKRFSLDEALPAEKCFDMIILASCCFGGRSIVWGVQFESFSFFVFQKLVR